MIRLVPMLVMLGVGFGVGVYWGVHHPADAQKLAGVEEKQFLEKQKVLLQKLKSKLDQMASSPATGAPSGGASGFLGASSRGKTDPEVDRLKAESDQQLAEVDKMLSKTK